MVHFQLSGLFFYFCTHGVLSQEAQKTTGNTVKIRQLWQLVVLLKAQMM